MERTRQIRAAVLGATGAVGQRYVSLLRDHPYITLAALMGGKSAGREYGEAMRQLGPEHIPEKVARMIVLPSLPASAIGCDVVFSALPSEAAIEIEPAFARAGFAVISKASAYRMHPHVPLIIPEVNPDHLRILELQKQEEGWKGCIVASPNCTVTGLSIVLKPIFDDFKVAKAVVNTMQAMSGDPNLSGWEMKNNIIPNIKSEEAKVREEASKIFGKLLEDRIALSRMPIEIRCSRVPVFDGHMETVYIEFSEKVNASDVISSIREFSGLPQRLQLPTAPKQPIVFAKGDYRPQHKLDLIAGSIPGMSVTVGRVEQGNDDKSVWLTLLSHNRIRGATGNALLIAELMESRRCLSD